MGELKKGPLLATTEVFPSFVDERRNTWAPYTFVNTPDNFSPQYIWSDGTDIYYSTSNGHYVLNGNVWEPKSWNITDFNGKNVWTDGTNIYHDSYYTGHYVLVDGNWETKEWDYASEFVEQPFGYGIWSDGENIFQSINLSQIVLNGNTWATKTWDFPEEERLNAENIWSDGTNIYCSYGSNHYIRAGDTWKPMTWDYDDINGNRVWTDGTNIWNSYGDKIFLFKDGKWVPKTMYGLPHVYKAWIWSDGKNIFYSYPYDSTPHYILTDKLTLTDQHIDPLSLYMGWKMGRKIAGMRK